MSRPKTKGESIAFRLPVHLDDVLQAIAYKRGVTSRDLACEIVAEWVNQQTRSSPVAAQAAAGKTSTHRASGLVDEFFGGKP